MTNRRTIWNWNGKAYTATWPDGTSAEMTVDLFSPGHGVLIRRTNTSGPRSGATFLYTGRIVGHAIFQGGLVPERRFGRTINPLDGYLVTIRTQECGFGFFRSETVS